MQTPPRTACPRCSPRPRARALVLAICLSAAGPAAGHETEPQAADCDGADPVPFLVRGGGSENCELDPADEIDAFKFLGAPGDVLRIIAVTEGSLDPRIVIRDPDGEGILDVSCDGGPPASPLPCVVEEDLAPLVFPELEYYQLQISDEGADEVGAYMVQLERIPPRFTTETIELSRDEFVDFAVLETPTDVDHFAFEALAGEWIEVEVESHDDYLDPRLEIWDPDSNRLEEVSCDGGTAPGPGTQCVLVGGASTPVEGRYTFSLSDVGHDEAGNQGGRYLYTFRRVPEPSRSAAALAALLVVRLLSVRVGRRSRQSATSAAP